jgi:hypothetical protein
LPRGEVERKDTPFRHFRQGHADPMKLTRIAINPGICTRKPCIRGLSFPVARLLAAGNGAIESSPTALTSNRKWGRPWQYAREGVVCSHATVMCMLGFSERHLEIDAVIRRTLTHS